jgi:2'-phosphotransferase
MERNHIHFAVDYPGGNVISGARANCDVFIEIDVPLAMQSGIVFQRSLNNVILTRGVNGFLSPKYFKKVTVKGQE